MINQSRDELTWQEGDLVFTEIIRQEYSNCVFSAGRVDNHPIDSCYLKLEKDGNITTFLLLRPDEVAAIEWLCNGVLRHMGQLEG